MEKSIEKIWKDGFVSDNALIVPKLNSLYSQKSKSIIDKLIRMYKININAIIIGSFCILGLSFLVGLQYMGIPLLILLNLLVLFDKKQMGKLEQIDKNVDSYTYLNAFNTWLKEKIVLNIKMYRYFYPLFVLSVAIGFWFQDVDGATLGSKVVAKILTEFPNIPMLFGIPVYGIIVLLLIMVTMAFLSGRLYRLDLKMSGYGGILRKLDELIEDIEELRS